MKPSLPVVTTTVLLAIACLASPAGAAPGAAWQEQAPPPAVAGVEEVLTAQLDAFNRQDVQALTANLAEEFAWFAVDTDATRLELRGRDAFQRSMQVYFRSVPSARAVIESMIVSGQFAAVQERAYWTDQRSGEELSQVSLAIYEVRDGLIHRVWYYPSTR